MKLQVELRLAGTVTVPVTVTSHDSSGSGFSDHDHQPASHGPGESESCQLVRGTADTGPASAARAAASSSDSVGLSEPVRQVGWGSGLSFVPLQYVAVVRGLRAQPGLTGPWQALLSPAVTSAGVAGTGAGISI